MNGPPICKLEAKKVPLLLDRTRRSEPVRSSVTTTSALLTGSPELSSSLPLIEDVVVCANTAVDKVQSTNRVAVFVIPRAKRRSIFNDPETFYCRLLLSRVSNNCSLDMKKS